MAVDGKTVRGSRTDGHAVHLLAAALHDSQTVIAQRQVAAKRNELPAFIPLLENLDLRGVVVTADAMHTQGVRAAGSRHAPSRLDCASRTPSRPYRSNAAA
ncbi:transposase [Streptomyces sp. NPDC004012]